MSKTYETGHAKNVANFETLLSYIAGYEDAYKPSNASIKLSNLKQKAELARTVSQHVNEVAALHSNEVAARELAFEPLRKLSTKMLNALKASNVPEAVIENAATNHRKLQGRRASAKLSEEEKQKLAASGTVVNQVSASQLSFDSQLESFDKQIKLLSKISQYAPNEDELQVASLSDLYTNLLQKNRDVVMRTTELSNSRLKRNTVIYDAENGLIALANDAKNYCKSVFGIGTPQYKQISDISFKYIKI